MLIEENKIPNLLVYIFIIWQDTIAPRLKKQLTKIIQKLLNLSGKTSDKLLVFIVTIIPKQNPIKHLLINKIIQEGITLNKLKKEISIKQKIIIFLRINLLLRNPALRLPNAIKIIIELDTIHP